MKTNITLRLESALVRDARVIAARRGTSVSRLLSEELEGVVRRDRAYETAHRRAKARLASPYDLGWTPPADRQELHER